MKRPTRWLVQVLAYGIFLAPVAYLSSRPVLQLLGEGEAVIRLAFSHAGNRVGDCRRLSQEELNELPPNMRNPMECPRERLPLFLIMKLNGDTLVETTLPPTGLWGDGETTVNRAFEVPAGTHRIEIGMRDSRRASGFDYHLSKTVEIEPHDNLVIGFDSRGGDFSIAGRQP